MKIGYARFFTAEQGLAAQLDAREIVEVNEQYTNIEHSLKRLLNVLLMFAEVEATLVRMRTSVGMQAAMVKGRPRGKKSKLSRTQEKLLVEAYRSGKCTTPAHEFGVARPTVCRALERGGAQ